MARRTSSTISGIIKLEIREAAAKRLINGGRPFSILAKMLRIDEGCLACLDMMSDDLSWPEQG
jgi:hypothetical protein